MRFRTLKLTFTLTAGALVLASAHGAYAQSPSAGAPIQTSSQPAPQQTAQADNSVQPDQPMSLGDLARLARAKRQSEPKAVKVVDDDNLERNGPGISVVGGGSGGPGGSSGSSADKVVLLDFWASWCGPCRESVPALKELRHTLGDQVEVISVNEDKDEKAGRSFAAENGMNWEQRFDPSGEMSRQYDVHAFPTFLLTDEHGNVLQRFVGEDSSQPLADRIGPYLPKANKGTL